MNGAITFINNLAVAWWPWILRATWQGLVVLALVLGVLAAWRRAPSTWRYGLLLIVLLKFALPPLGLSSHCLFGWVPPAAPAAVAAPVPASFHAAALGHAGFPADFALAPAPGLDAETMAPIQSLGHGIQAPRKSLAPKPLTVAAASLTPAGWMLLAQFCGAVALLACILYQAHQLRRSLRQARRLESGPLHALAGELATMLGLRHLPRIFMTDRLNSPQAGGLRRPFVLLPTWVAEAPEEDQRALLAHELAHLRRRDPLAAWLQLLIQAWLWWNPAVWWLNRRIRVERELCCDDLVLGMKLARGEGYSRVLVDVAARMTRREAALELAGMADSFQAIRVRIRRVLDAGLRRPVRLSLASLAALLLFAAFVLPGSDVARGAKAQPAASAAKATPALTPPAGDQKATFTVTGTVLLPDDKPAAGAEVSALSWSDWSGPVATARANASGKFTMALPPETYWFLARSGNFGNEDTTDVKVGKDGKVSRAPQLRLEAGCAVEGKVVEQETGKPVAGALIVGDEGDRTASGADGTFRIAGLAHKDHSITAAKTGLCCPVVYFDTTGRDRTQVLLETRPGGTIHGRVTDETGKPLAGATVRDHRSGSIWICGLRRTVTDAQGEYALSGYALDGPVWSMGVEAKGRPEASRGDLRFAAGTNEIRVDFQLGKVQSVAAAAQKSGGSSVASLRVLSGRVTDGAGKPVAGTQVGFGSSTAWVHYREVKTDAQGNYKLDGAQSEAALLVVQAKGFAPAAQTPPAKGDATLDFKLEPGHWIEGRLSDETGKPLAGAWIETMGEFGGQAYRYLSKEARTDKNGHFRIEDLPAQRVLVDIGAQGHSTLSELPLTVDSKGHDLILPDAGQLSGTVVGADGKPVTRFKVFMGFPQAKQQGDKSSGFSAAYSSAGVSFISPDGTFTISGLDVANVFRVTIDAPGYARTALDRVQTRPVSQINYKEAVFKMEPAGGFSGTVSDEATGRGIAGVAVSLLDSGGQESEYFSWSNDPRDSHPVTTQTDAQGRFEFKSVPVARGAVALTRAGYGRTLVKGVVCAKPFAARMGKAATIEGRFLDAGGKPRASVTAELKQEHTDFGRVPSDAEGRFAFTDLPPGKYQLIELNGNTYARIYNVTLKAGETHTVDWDKPGPATLEGALTDHGKPLTGVHVLLNDAVKPDLIASGVTDAQGRYRLSIPELGPYRLFFRQGEYRAPNYFQEQRKITIKAGRNELNIALPGGGITGQVVDAQTGKSLAGAAVMAYCRKKESDVYGENRWFEQHTEPGWFPQGNPVTADKEGRFSIGRLTAGPWLLVVMPSGFPSATLVPSLMLTLGQDEEKKDIRLEIGERGAAHIGAVDAATGQPVAVLMVECVNADGFQITPIVRQVNSQASDPRRRGEPEKDDAGRVSFENLPPGRYRAYATTDEYPVTGSEFEVRAGHATETVVKLVRGGRLGFRLPPEARQQGAFYWVGYRLRKPGSGEPALADVGGPTLGSFVSFDADKPEAFVPLPAGEYQLEAVLRKETRAGSLGSTTDLWHATQSVKIETGKDLMITATPGGV